VDNPKKPADSPKEKPADDPKKPTKDEPKEKPADNPKKPAGNPKEKPADDPKKPTKDEPKEKPADNPKEKPAKDEPKEKPADPKKPDNPKEKPAKDEPKEKPADPKKPDNPKEKPNKEATKPAAGGDKGKPDAPKIVYPLSTRDPLPIAAVIDRELNKRLAEAKLPPSPQADDAEFLRRVHLDITGRIPSLARARSFLDSTDTDKRRKLIDELLVSGDFGQHFGTIWRNLIMPRGPIVEKNQGNSFGPWITEQFNRNRGWNEVVFDLLTAEGDTRSTPQASFIMANTENQQPQPNMIAAATTRLFLGVQLQCAECHDHPFSNWKQKDFWATAAFFARLRNGGNKGGPITLTEVLDTTAQPEGKKGEGRLKITAGGGIVIPSSAGKGAGQIVNAKFLEGEPPVLDDQKPLRPVLAEWATSPSNKYFAQAFVNRLWGQFFGRGFVNPVDNFRDDQPPSHPELLRLLADEFKASGHDVKHLVRCICNSQAYQRMSRPLSENEGDTELFSHMAVKPLAPEALFDSLLLVINPMARTGKEGGFGSRDEFVMHFRTQGDGEAGEFTHGIPQFLRRLNGAAFNGGGPLVGLVARGGADKDEALDSLYLATLSRRPTAKERQLMSDYMAKKSRAEDGYAGVLWILLNSGEFVLNH
jgi:hypothetical protein